MPHLELRAPCSLAGVLGLIISALHLKTCLLSVAALEELLNEMGTFQRVTQNAWRMCGGWSQPPSALESPVIAHHTILPMSIVADNWEEGSALYCPCLCLLSFSSIPCFTGHNYLLHGSPLVLCNSRAWPLEGRIFCFLVFLSPFPQISPFFQATCHSQQSHKGGRTDRHTDFSACCVDMREKESPP